MREDEATKLFGTNNLNGDGSLDRFVTLVEMETGLLWVPVFEDESELLSALSGIEQVLPEAGGEVVVVKLSKYTQSQIERAYETIKELARTVDGAFAFSYSPVRDSIVVEGSENVRTLPATVEGVVGCPRC